MRVRMRITSIVTIEKMKVANKVWPDTIFESIYEMTNLIPSHRETKRPLIDLRDLESFVMTSNATLKGHSHRIVREREGSRGERDHQEKFLGRMRWRKMDRFSKPVMYLIGHRKAMVEIPVQKVFHGEDQWLDPW